MVGHVIAIGASAGGVESALIRQVLMKEEPPAEPPGTDAPAAGKGGPG